MLASAVGPLLLLAWCAEWTGGCAPMFRVLAPVIGGTAVAALIVAMPDPSGVPAVALPDAE